MPSASAFLDEPPKAEDFLDAPDKPSAEAFLDDKQPSEYEQAVAATDAARNAIFGPGSIAGGMMTVANLMRADQKLQDEERKKKVLSSGVKELLGGSFLDQSPESLAALDVTTPARAGIDAMAASGITPGEINLKAFTIPEGAKTQEDVQKGFRGGGDMATLMKFPTIADPNVAAGLLNSVSGAASGLGTPENLALMTGLGVAPKIVQTAASGIFATSMLINAYEKAAQAHNEATPGKQAQAYGEAFLETLMGAGAGVHFAGRSSPVSGRGLLTRRPGTPEDVVNLNIHPLQKFLPEPKALTDDGKLPVSPVMLDQLHLAREKLVEHLQKVEPTEQPRVQQWIDALDNDLLSVDRNQVAASRVRVAERGLSPPPEVIPASPETAPSPQRNPNRSPLFDKRSQEGAAPSDEPVGQAPTPPVDETAPPVPDQHPVGTKIASEWGTYEKRPNGEWREVDENGYVVSGTRIVGTPKGEVIEPSKTEASTTPTAPKPVDPTSPEFVKAATKLNQFRGVAEAAAEAAGAPDPEQAVSDAIHGTFDKEGKHNTEGSIAAKMARGEIDPKDAKKVLVAAAENAGRNQKRGQGDVMSTDAQSETGSTPLESTPSEAPTPDEAAAKSDQALAVTQVVEQLPDHLKKTAQAKLENPEASNREIADKLGISHTTVADHLKAMQEHFQSLRDEDTLSNTDAPHAAPVAGQINPKIAKDISPKGLGIRPSMPPFLEKITDVLSGISDHPSVSDFGKAFKGWIGGLAGKTFPKLTALNREVGEKAARWISSRIAAKPSADLFSSKVLEGLKVDPLKFGAALHEDNLRSIRKGYEDAGNTDAANGVNTIIGGKGSPFKTEADYQAFLDDPQTQLAIERHKALWDDIIAPQYRHAMSLDPDEKLPERGLQTGARINLNNLRESDAVKDKVFTVGRGNLLGTLKKKSIFGRQATGTGEGYGMNYTDIMRNTFGKQLEVANKNHFEDAMVDAGLAKIEQPGQPVTINGREAKAFPYKRQTLILKNGQPMSQSRSIYIDPRIAGEYEIGSNVQKNVFEGGRGEFPAKVASAFNRAALAGLTDATVHVSNLGSAMFTRPGTSGGLLTDTLLSSLGRADVPVTLIRSLVKGFKDNQQQIKELSEIGAMRSQHESGSSLNPLNLTGKFIQWADRTARLTLDDAFKSMADKGIVENTETNRREFVNQVGQYNKRAQGSWTRAARDSGLAPFVTAGKNFNALAVRTALLDPGVKATSVPAALALRANQAAKWLGAATLIGSLNYLITGKATGRDGVPLGSVDTGKNDENGRPLYIKVSDWLGLGRAVRVTGIRGAVEAKRAGLTNQDALDSAVRDIGNSAMAPWEGPPIRALGVATGIPTAIGVKRPAPVVAPGESQRASDLKYAAIEANPIFGSIHDRYKTGGGITESLQRQLPRYLPQSGKSDEFMSNYPKIVHKAQASSFIDDVIGRARPLSGKARRDVIDEAMNRLSTEDRKTLRDRLKYRHVAY